ncbi:MAG: hypothetical protein V1725_00465 [archaeon]
MTAYETMKSRLQNTVSYLMTKQESSITYDQKRVEEQRTRLKRSIHEGILPLPSIGAALELRRNKNVMSEDVRYKEQLEGLLHDIAAASTEEELRAKIQSGTPALKEYQSRTLERSVQLYTEFVPRLERMTDEEIVNSDEVKFLSTNGGGNKLSYDEHETARFEALHPEISGLVMRKLGEIYLRDAKREKRTATSLMYMLPKGKCRPGWGAVEDPYPSTVASDALNAIKSIGKTLGFDTTNVYAAAGMNSEEVEQLERKDADQRKQWFDNCVAMGINPHELREQEFSREPKMSTRILRTLYDTRLLEKR